MITETRAIIDGLLDLIYPPKCLGCQTLNPSYLCSKCISKIKPIELPYCSKCGHPLTEPQCRNCHDRTLSFTAARAVGEYEGTLRNVIHEFKYHGNRVLAEPLAQQIYDYLIGRVDIPWRKADYIIPVPMHPVRKRLRGYNQSELLAERLAKLTDIPFAGSGILRIRQTRPQVELTSIERMKNLQNAFHVSDSFDLKGKIVMLVDDVTTTGSTTNECSKVLRKAGASKVYAVCLAVDI